VLCHGAEYFGLGLLIFRAWNGGLDGLSSAWRVGVAFLMAAGCGVVDEWHQSFVPLRESSGADVAADALGSAAGVSAGALLARLRRPRGRPEIILVTRAGCARCEAALSELRRLHGETSFHLRVRDVDAWSAWKEMYGNEVPVILMDGRPIARGRVEPARLAAALRRRAGS
jgi:hypothetical protein